MKKKILLIEDDTTLAEGLKLILDDEGYIVSVLPDGNELLLHMEEFKPDVVVMDYRLPGEDGGTLTKKIRSKSSFKTVPVIMISASLSNMNKIAKDFGANAFLPKPFQISELLNLIKNF